jgi:SAM-dependent methyltransferase
MASCTLDSIDKKISKRDKCVAVVDPEKVVSLELQGGAILDKRIPIENHQSALGRDFFFVNIKETFKQFPRLYYLIVTIVSPLYAPYMTRKMRNKLLQPYLDRQATVINIGSGNTPIHSKVINIDLYAYGNVDIVSDATDLCLKSEVADLIVNESSLEHIYNFKDAIKESYRVLKKGGKGYFNIPFLVGFHASPNDFHRFTHAGLQRLFEEFGFKVEELKVLSGPASSFLWIIIELLAMSLSFGFKPLYQVLYFLFMGLLFPIKFLDGILNRIAFSKNIAATFYVIVSK